MDLQNLTDAELLELYETTKQQIAECHNKQLALKILLNGGYGALTNEFNRWYSDDLAESITLSGQLSARWIINWLNNHLNKHFGTNNVDYVIACDTDSVHIDVTSAVVGQFGTQTPSHTEKMDYLEKFGEELNGVIEQGYERLYQVVNAFMKAMHMKLETISHAIWTGKKHYVMETWYKEGTRLVEPKLKMVGIEAVKSSTPKIIREWLTEGIKLVVADQPKALQKFIDEKRAYFKTLAFDQVALPRGVTELEKYGHNVTIYGKATPIHVRGCLLYNHYIKKLNLHTVLPAINSGDKVRFCYMKLPNPLNENVFACPDTLPPELELDSYIDYDLQFDKAFVKPLNAFVDAVLMNLSDDIDISQFFED